MCVVIILWGGDNLTETNGLKRLERSNRFKGLAEPHHA